MLFSVDHQPYNVMMLFIELKDEEGFAVGPGLRYLLLLLFRLTNIVLRVRCLTVRNALFLSPLYVVGRDIPTQLGCSSKRLQHDATPSETPWVSHFSLLSDRIRPPSRSPQPIKSENGKRKSQGGHTRASAPQRPSSQAR